MEIPDTPNAEIIDQLAQKANGYGNLLYGMDGTETLDLPENVDAGMLDALARTEIKVRAFQVSTVVGWAKTWGVVPDIISVGGFANGEEDLAGVTIVLDIHSPYDAARQTVSLQMAVGQLRDFISDAVTALMASAYACGGADIALYPEQGGDDENGV